MFEFVNCRPDRRFDRACWYVVLNEGDQEAFEAIHQGVCHMLYQRFDQDPHVTRSPEYTIFNAAHLGGLWAQGLELMFLNYGAAFVGMAGGMIPPVPENEIIARVRRKTLQWPDADVRIIISRWPGGRHWYLSSTQGVVFFPVSFKTCKAAEDHARLISSKVTVIEDRRAPD